MARITPKRAAEPNQAHMFSARVRQCVDAVAELQQTLVDVDALLEPLACCLRAKESMSEGFVIQHEKMRS